MVNRFLLFISLITVFVFTGVSAADIVHCTKDDGKLCSGTYCYYVNYTEFVNNTITNHKILKGCRSDFQLWIPDENGALWTFPINHCQHFQTNQTATTYQYIYGNFCNSRDNCTYNDGGDPVCAGLQTSFPTLAAIVLMVAGIFIAKIFV